MIAIVHDYIKEYGGAEKVLEELAKLYPNAPIYAILYRPNSLGPHRQRLEKLFKNRIHPSFVSCLPFAEKLISPLRFLSPLLFKLFNFSKYDTIITSATGAYFPNAINKKSAKLICYCHTPPRYLYHLSTARKISPLLEFLIAPIFSFFRVFDYNFAQNVDTFIANSQTVRRRIIKYYRRDAIVINPPVSFPKLKPITKQSFFVTGGRLAAAKRYDIAIEACNNLKIPLKIFGRDFANHLSDLKKLAGPTIEFLGEISNDQKFKLFQEARAFIFPSDNEDFGILPIEVMACGCPVIAHKSGGVQETVVDGKTGIFFKELTPESCISAINKFLSIKFDPRVCRNQALKFSQKVFVKKIKAIIKNPKPSVKNFYPLEKMMGI